VGDKDKVVASAVKLELNKIIEEWELILKYIRQENVVVYALLKEGRPIDVENNVITIGYKENFSVHKEALERKHQEFVNKTISSYFNNNTIVKFVLEDEILSSSNDNSQGDNLDEVIDFFGEDFVEIKND